LVRGTGALGHLRPSRSGFVIHPLVDPAGLRRRRVLVVDDSYTTGSRAQSAAAALRLAGMRVGAILVLGRVVAPRSCPWHAGFWAARPSDQGSGHSVGWEAPGWASAW
ncbi:MAG TPA: phosphoribosyltransferase, partial [Acidimicrobiales bacterium]|nr:phosphoribosyltransferase [Acidimicrobiales bacterium]